MYVCMYVCMYISNVAEADTHMQKWEGDAAGSEHRLHICVCGGYGSSDCRGSSREAQPALQLQEVSRLDGERGRKRPKNSKFSVAPGDTLSTLGLRVKYDGDTCQWVHRGQAGSSQGQGQLGWWACSFILSVPAVSRNIRLRMINPVMGTHNPSLRGEFAARGPALRFFSPHLPCMAYDGL
jgi:hypothetical protein